MELRKFITTTIREYLNENKRNVEVDMFKKEHPDIHEIKFDLNLIKDSIIQWKLNNYDVNILDKKIVDNMIIVNNNNLPPIIIYKYTKSGGYKIIDGWHRSLASLLRGDKYINALVKDYTIEALP